MQELIAGAQRLLAEAFVLWGSPVTWLEILAFVLALWMVVCNMRVQVLAWPLAIVSSLLYAWLFSASRLYGEASLQGLFVVVSCWGWWQWQRGRDGAGQPLTVRSMARREWLLAGALTTLAWPLVALLLMRLTDSDVPWLDALATVGSVTGQALLGRKRVENWLVWLAVNVFSIGLFAMKGLWLTVALYAIFAALSLAGWRAWRQLAASPA